jgi:endoribonuclease Dicer
LEKEEEFQYIGEYSSNISNIENWDDEKWKKEFEDKKIFVMTAQILLNNLIFGIIKFETIDLLVFDECHHCKKNHPYNKIMGRYYKISEKKPRVLGLTASPASVSVHKDIKNIKIVKNLEKLKNAMDCIIYIIETDTIENEFSSTYKVKPIPLGKNKNKIRISK